ncbi:MAG TPA: LysE family transporter [Bacteroidales bacterium]|nr:LysE family transporter [Bacteroidales bacterium]HPT03206.1 LysE family transporter [Bacteroidales bacterium]
MHPLIQGMILGLTLAALLGPALFTLLQTSIHRGWRSGVFLAIGIIVSDFSVLMLAYLGALQLINKRNNYLIAGIIGGIILILFGIYTFNRKIHFDENNNPVETKVAGPLTYILKGYFLNIMNPFVWFFWISSMVGVSSNFGDDKHSIMIFFIGTLSITFSTDILKVFAASKLKRHLNGKILLFINHSVGIILMLFGVFLMIRTVVQF